MTDLFLCHNSIPPYNIGQNCQNGIKYFALNISDFVVLVGSGDLESWVDDPHEEIPIDIDEDAHKAYHYSPCLVPIDGHSVQIVVDNEDKQGSCDEDGIYERKREDEV